MKLIKNIATALVVATCLPGVALADWVFLEVDGSAERMIRGVASKDELIGVLKEYSEDLSLRALPEAGGNVILVNVTKDVRGFIMNISQNGEAMGIKAARPVTEREIQGFNIGMPPG